MPNWCTTNITFEGNKKDIKDFHEKLIKITKTPSRIENDFGSHWLGNVVDYFVLDSNVVRCRGSISYIDTCFDLSEEECYFEIVTDTAWEPMINMWSLIIEEYYPSISFVYVAEEPGCEIFINTDTEGKHYTDRFLLDLRIPLSKKGAKNIEERGYFESEEEVIKYINQLFNKTFSSVKEIEACFSNLVDKHEDYLASIIEFTTE